MRWIVGLVVALPGLAMAQGMRDGDQVFGSDELVAQVSGNVLTFYDGSMSRYGEDGAYDYKFEPQGRAFEGQYETGDDSRICVVFKSGHDRCDTIVMASGRLVLITEDGTRFPIRQVEPIE